MIKAPSATVMAWRRRKDIFTNHRRLNQLITEVFVEQPLALPGSAKNKLYKQLTRQLAVVNYKNSVGTGKF